MQTIHFEQMSDDRVLEGVESLVGRSNAITAELLAYLAEVEERRLHLAQACSSLFAFCVERLHMSESAAGKRIWAARTARRFPLVLEMIERGELHLTAVNLLAPHLTDENHAEVLARARHRSKRECERLVAELAPRPDLPSRVLALSARLGPAPIAPAQAVRRCPEARPARVAPLSPRRYEIRVTVDEDTHAKLRQLQDLLSHQAGGRDPAVIVSRAIDALLAQTLARRAAITDRPRPGKPPAGRSRYIPAAIRREVWKRDGGRCAFVDARGQRCTATAFIQFHHPKNWARGAKHSAKEIELRCQMHNLYQAEIDYGADFIAACRASAPSKAREPRAAYRPGLARPTAFAGECSRALPAGDTPRRPDLPRTALPETEPPRAMSPPAGQPGAPPQAHPRRARVTTSWRRSSSASCWR